MFAHPLDLVCKYVRRRHLDSGRKVDDHLIVRCRSPCSLDRVADIKRIVHLCSGKALRGILQDHFSVIIFHVLLYHIDTVDCDLLDLLAVHMEYNITL